jgi:hypothetical protein
MQSLVSEVFGTAEEMFALLQNLNWNAYRREVLKLDPEREVTRLKKHIHNVEALFGVPLEGETVLFGAFTSMDGYARFDRGTHRVFLGVDESHGRGQYLDILEVHELTHVVRESQPEVWQGWGLDPQMTHDQFVENQPVIEHLFGEGFSCAVSEILVSDEEPHHYAYQEKIPYKKVLKNSATLNQTIHQELLAGERGDWGRLYSPSSYKPRLPVFSHYVWAWQWAKQLIHTRGKGRPADLMKVCSREFLQNALKFELGTSIN